MQNDNYLDKTRISNIDRARVACWAALGPVGLVRWACAGYLADGISSEATGIPTANICAATELVIAIQIPATVFGTGLAVLT